MHAACIFSQGLLWKLVEKWQGINSGYILLCKQVVEIWNLEEDTGKSGATVAFAAPRHWHEYYTLYAMSACLCCTWWVAAVLLLNAPPVPRCFPIFYFPPSWHNSTHCPPGPRPTEGLCACIPPQLRCFSPGPLTVSTTAPLPSHKKTMRGMWWVNYNPHPPIPYSSFIVGDHLSPRFHLHPPSQNTGWSLNGGKWAVTRHLEA